MANQPQNSKPARRSLSVADLAKPERKWTALLIANHGKVITLRRFKELILAGILTLVVAIAVAAGFFYLNQNINNEKKQLEIKVKKLNDKIETLGHQKDILMARLVLAESRLQESKQDPRNGAGRQANTATNRKDSGETGPPDMAVDSINVKVPDQQQPEPRKELAAAKSNLSVAIENFKISVQSDQNAIRVQFKIKNTSSNSQRVSGHAIVVLKGDQVQPGKWLPIPRMPLAEGRPNGQQRGHAFGINYFKTMRFRTAMPEFPGKYHTAAVYVFTRQGELLLEQDFPIKLPDGAK